jgi:hypothetical protein
MQGIGPFRVLNIELIISESRYITIKHCSVSIHYDELHVAYFKHKGPGDKSSVKGWAYVPSR